MPSRPKPISPALQMFVMCEAVETDDDGVPSLRKLFDTIAVPGYPSAGRFTAAATFIGGTGAHRYWVRVTRPDETTIETNEITFFLASKDASHRIMSRLDLVVTPETVGKYRVAAVLDGRVVLEIPLRVEGPKTT